jgi:hypothetical protein
MPYNEIVALSLDRLTDNELLDLRFSDLSLKIKGTRLEQRLSKLHQELLRRRLPFRPHVWLSEEWFTPDGVTGFAIPFYLAHSRLIKLERAQMLQVEGASESECMRILRHEAGHAISNAYRLHARRSWADTFGLFRSPYPEWYQPQPDSRDYVLNLDAWYAQAHPAEDFAETFAVWLQPGAQWRRQYLGWGALRKLQYVDRLMEELTDKKPAKNSRLEIDPLSTLTMTLREHYHRKRRYYTIHWPSSFDRNLYRIFSKGSRHANSPSAAHFLRRVRREVGHTVAEGTGVHMYTVDHVIRHMIVRCRQLGLHVSMPESESKELSVVVLTMQVMQGLRTGYHRIPL